MVNEYKLVHWQLLIANNNNHKQMLNTVAEPPQPLQISGGIVECHATLVAINHYYLQHYLSQTRWYIN